MKKVFLGLIVIVVVGTIGYFFKDPIFDYFRSGQIPELSSEMPPTTKQLFAVSIDNSPEARPQTGLAVADVVIETLAEGGVTRFLAFYSSASDSPTEKIGPVRSARPYFVDWAFGQTAVLAHSGGSKEALEKIENTDGLFDANEFYNEKYYWRDAKLRAPHNLFTSMKLLGELAEKKNWETDPLLQFLPTGGGGKVGGIASNISVDFSYAPYAVAFNYNSDSRVYERKQSGSPKIFPKNVVVMYTDSTVIDKSLLTIDLRTTGSGKAVVFRGGSVQQVRWKKEGATAPLQLLDADGTGVVLAPGLTWFVVLDQAGSASWK